MNVLINICSFNAYTTPTLLAHTVDTFPIVNLDLSVYRSFSLMTMMGKVECDDPWWLGA